MLSIVSTASKMCDGALKRKHHTIAISIIALLLILPSVTPVFAVVDYLNPEDFDEKSWSKIVDYLEYVDVCMHACMGSLDHPQVPMHTST